MSTEKLDALQTITTRAERILILPHNDPDPDAIGSAVALRHLMASWTKAQITIGYRGLIGRAENKALVSYLDTPLQRLSRADIAPPVTIALVDTQPASGNSPVKQFGGETIVIDHHPWHADSARAGYVDVRPEIGSTSTILVEYFRTAGIDPPPSIATALFYGIKSDTMGLGRSATPADIEAYAFLVPRIDSQSLFEIERAQVAPAYFLSLVDAVRGARIYRDVLIVYLGWMKYPDLAAEIADWFLRLKGIQWVICLGAYKDNLYVAIRSRHPAGGAGRLAQVAVGSEGTAGGHSRMAGGQILLKGRDPEKLAYQVGLAILADFKIDPEETQRALL